MSRWVQVHTKASSFDLPNVVFLGVIARDVAVLLLLQVWSNQRLETTDMMLMCMYTTRKRKLVLMNFSPYSIIPLLIHTSNRSQSLKNEYAIFFFLLSVWRIDKWSIVVFVTNVKMQTFYKIVQIFVLFFLLFRSHQSMCVAFRTVSLYIVVLRSFHIQMLMNLNNTSLKLQVWLTFFFRMCSQALWGVFLKSVSFIYSFSLVPLA